MTKTARLAELLKPPTTAPRYLGFNQAQWRVAVKAWLPLLPSLGFAWFFALLSVGHTLSHQPAWLFTVWAQLLVILALEKSHQAHWQRMDYGYR